ncbi:MAG: TetR/AcrR family transcriptional regulator [Oscillospiraceae bacterium]
MENNLVRTNIINATIQCIGKHGIQSVTNRLIAKEANVNSASINYYFSSKEKLIDEAIKCSLDSYFSEFFNEPLNLKQETGSKLILKQFLMESLKDALSSPHFIKSYLYESIVHDDYSGIFFERFNTFLNNLYEEVDTQNLGEIEQTKKMSIIQMVSSIMFVSLLPNFFNGFLKVDFRESNVQKDYVDHLLNHFYTKDIE